MQFEKRAQLVKVGQRKVIKEGRELSFYDLHLVVPNEGIAKVSVSQEVAMVASGMVGGEVVLMCELEPDRRTSWLYSLRVLSVVAAGDKVVPARERNAV